MSRSIYIISKERDRKVSRKIGKIKRECVWTKEGERERVQTSR